MDFDCQDHSAITTKYGVKILGYFKLLQVQHLESIWLQN